MFGFYSLAGSASVRTFPYTTYVRDTFGNDVPQYTYLSPTVRSVGANPNNTQTWEASGESGFWLDTPNQGYIAPFHQLPDTPKQVSTRPAPVRLTDAERAARIAAIEYRMATKPMPKKARTSNRVASPNRVSYGTLPPAMPQTGVPLSGDLVVDSCLADVSRFDPMIRGIVASACGKGYDRYYTSLVDANAKHIGSADYSPKLVKKHGRGREALPQTWWEDIYQTVLVWVIEQMANNCRVYNAHPNGGYTVLDPNSRERMRGWIRKAEQDPNTIIPFDPRIVGAVARRACQTILDNRSIRTDTEQTDSVPDRDATVSIPGMGDAVELRTIVDGLFQHNPDLGDAVWELFVTRAKVGGCLAELSPDDVARRFGIHRTTLFKGMRALTQTLSEHANAA